MTSRSPSSEPSILPILSVNFIGTLGFSIVLPFLVFLVTKWGGNALVYGLVGATYSFFQLIGAPMLGRWSDRIGRRKVLLLSQFGTFVSWLLFLSAFVLPETPLANFESGVLGTFSLTLPLIALFVARAADGITGGNISVANAYLADVTEEDKRNENFGKMAVSGNLGFVFGPVMAGVLGATVLGELLPALAAAAISAVATLLILFFLPESNPCAIKRQLGSENVRRVFGQEPKECYRIEAGENLSMREILNLEGIRPLMTTYFLVMLAFNFFYVTFPVYVVQIPKWDVTETGLFFAILSGLMVLVQGPILKRLARKVADAKLLVAGSLLLAASFLFFMSSQTAIIYGGAALLAAGNGLMWPSLIAILSRVAGSKYQGTVQGMAGSIGAVASIMGLLIGGFLYNFIGSWLFALSAGLIGVTSLLSLLAARNTPEPHQTV